jgi:hypothetical protein
VSRSRLACLLVLLHVLQLLQRFRPAAAAATATAAAAAKFRRTWKEYRSISRSDGSVTEQTSILPLLHVLLLGCCSLIMACCCKGSPGRSTGLSPAVTAVSRSATAAAAAAAAKLRRTWKEYRSISRSDGSVTERRPMPVVMMSAVCVARVRGLTYSVSNFCTSSLSCRRSKQQQQAQQHS